MARSERRSAPRSPWLRSELIASPCAPRVSTEGCAASGPTATPGAVLRAGATWAASCWEACSIATSPATTLPPASTPTSATLATAAEPSARPPADAPPTAALPVRPAAPSTLDLRPRLGTTGNAAASSSRCRRTSSRYALQPGQPRRWWRSSLRRSAPPRRVASCSRISAHGVTRASRRSMRAVRARNTRPFTLPASQPSTSATSACESPAASASSSAARCSSGSSRTSARSSRSSARCSTCSLSPSVGSSWSSDACSRRARNTDTQRLRAIV